jgi:hypothetical protein
MRPLLLATLALPVLACQGPQDSVEAPTSQPVAAQVIPATIPGWDSFGGAFEEPPLASRAVQFEDLATNPSDYDGKTFHLAATVDEVCQTKGCWMTFSNGDSTMRVKFKDYAFFMPMDASGREAVIAGEFKVQIVPAAEAAHYLEDAGKMEEAAAITEDQLSLTFMASAVILAQ